MSKYCKQCGTELKDNVKFCTKCGMQCENSIKTGESVKGSEKSKKKVLGKKKKNLLIGVRSVYKELHADRETGC